jgi:protein-L-isoaspartate(D-aspartate) O-methyltransferase
MIDFAAARRNMVDGQIRTQDVTDPRVIGAFFDLPREQFLPAGKAGLAYLDLDVTVADGPNARRLLKPMVLAKLIQAAGPAEGDRVLDVACGTGYSAAILSQLGARVVALEDDATLVRQARKNLGDAVKVVTGPLTAGWAAEAPYSVIFLNGATEITPQHLFDQLADGGRLVCVVGANPGKAMLYVRSGAEVGARPLFDANASILPGFVKAPAFVF